MNPVIITAALVGGELNRSDTPYLPITPQEIGREAVEVVRQGASIVHLHARDKEGRPRHEVEIFAQIVQEIREQCQANQVGIPVIQFSTGGSIGMTLEERMAPLVLKPEMASLTTGSVNFGQDVFENPVAVMVAIAQKAKEVGCAIELEIFDAGMIDNALNLFEEGHLTEPLHFNFVLGVPGGLLGDPQNLVFLKGRIPETASWSVAGIGRYQLPLAVMSLALGGHVRVGLEDNIFFRKGELAKGNAPLVARVARIARELGREPATPEMTREILQLGRRDERKGSQRKHPRVPMMVKVLDQETGEEKEFFSREVSVGGIFLEMEAPYAVGKTLNLRFSVPGSGQIFRVTGRVTHRTSKKKDKFQGVGLHFLDLSVVGEKVIADYVDRLEKIRKKLSEEK